MILIFSKELIGWNIKWLLLSPTPGWPESFLPEQKIFPVSNNYKKN